MRLGARALLGAVPRGSLVLSILGKNIAERVPPPRRRVPLPTAAKEPKRRFFRPRRLELPSGGQNLSGLRPSFRATGPWRGKCLGLPLPPGPPGSCHVVWPAIDGGPMRHRPLPTDDSFCVGADVPIRPRQLPSSYGWWQPARVPRPAKQAFPNRPASGSGAEAESISCTTRAGVAEQSPGKRPP